MTEDEVIPANPDNEYGWEKYYAERMAQAYARHYPIEVRVARFQNCYGPEGTWRGGREKAPAAICRKVAMADGGRHHRRLGRRHRRARLHLRRRPGGRHLPADAVGPGRLGEYRDRGVRDGQRAGADGDRRLRQGDSRGARGRARGGAGAEFQSRADA